jgi:hypothetical protein
MLIERPSHVPDWPGCPCGPSDYFLTGVELIQPSEDGGNDLAHPPCDLVVHHSSMARTPCPRPSLHAWR